METVFFGLNNAYILFSIILGVYAASLAGRDVLISGEFWGAIWINTGLAAAILLVSIILTLQGLRPVGTNPDDPSLSITRDVYYLYAVYFVISLPGVFAIMHGNDNRRATIFYSLVTFFNAAAAYRAVYWLLEVWE